MVKIEMILDSLTYQKELESVKTLGTLAQSLMGKKILVTGATGLIGSAIIDALMKLNELYNYNIAITGMCRNRKKAEIRFAPYLERNFSILARDVCEAVAEESEWNYIIHAAGNAHPSAFSAQPVETMKANLLGTINLLEHGRSQKERLEKFIYISTGEIYGDADEYIFQENTRGVVDCTQVRACYPESKRAAETLCVSYMAEYGLNTGIARLGYIYGPNFDESSSKADIQFLKKAAKGENIVLKSAGTQYRSYCYVLDAVFGIFYILLKGECGQAYNISDENSGITIRGLAELLARLSGTSVVFENIGAAEQKGCSNMQREVLGTEKLRELGWHPETGLEQGLAKTLSALKEKYSYSAL